MRRMIWMLLLIILLTATAAVCLSEGNALSLEDYTVVYGGKKYTVPISYKEFTEAGWKSSEIKADDDLPATSRTVVVSFHNKDLRCSVDLINWDISSRKAEECYLSSLRFYCHTASEFILPGGIDFAVSTRDDITKAFGKPDRETGYSITYGDYDKSWTFEFDGQGMLDEVEIENTTRPAAFVDAPLNADEPNDIQTLIPEKEVFSNDLSLQTFKLDGDIYRLPVQVNELIRNGWVIERVQDEYVGSGDYSYVTLQHGDSEKQFYIRNYSSRAAKPEYCFICELDIGIYDHFSLELGNNIAVGGKLENLTAYLSENIGNISPDETYKYYSFYYYYNGDKYNNVSFSISYNDDEIINGIYMSYKPGRSDLDAFIQHYNENIGKE